MKISDREIRREINILRMNSYDAEHLQKVIQSSKEAFYVNEQNDILTGPEFLYQQAGYIRKRWWVLQGILLMSIWALLKYAVMGNYYVQRCMGIAAPVFVLLLLPELWKNRTYNAMEVEGTSYFSLRPEWESIAQGDSASVLSAACRDLLHLFSDTVQSESGFGGKFHVSVYCMVHPVAAADIKWKNI